MHKFKQLLALLLSLTTVLALAIPASAEEVQYLPDVTEEMTDHAFWANLQKDADEIILTPDEITAYNQSIMKASGTMVTDLKGSANTFDGVLCNEQINASATSDAEYYMGWTYDPNTGELADWSYFQEMIDNCQDPNATEEMPYRYGIAVNRTVLKVFPSDKPVLDDPKDFDFDYQSLSGVRVNEPVLISTTSKDGKYFLARTDDCSGWISVDDVAVCANKAEWLSAWNLPSEKLLVVYGNRVYTDASNVVPVTSQRLLTQGTALELVGEVSLDEVIINRYPYHNYVVYLPIRAEDGSYSKQKAFISEKAEVNVGYLPLTMRNISMVAMENLGDTYGWGGMLNVEDCSGQVRTIYECFGLDIARNGNWQWNMDMEKIDLSYMSLEEKCAVVDALPLGSALCFPGHEMLYLGKYNEKYYVISSVSSIMNPATEERQRVRGTILNTLDIKRANGQTWLEAINTTFMPCYAKLDGKSYSFPVHQWYREGVGYVLKNNLIENYENGYFGLDDNASREVLVNALWCLEGQPESKAEHGYTDVLEDKHYVSAISWANENGLIQTGDGSTFGPEEALTREEMLTILWRYAKNKGYDLSEEENTDIRPYADDFKISEYAVSAMQWACGAGLVEGEKKPIIGMVLSPKKEITRAQLSMVLLSFDEWMKQAEYAPHVFDLSQGDIMFSAGAEEYSSYLAAESAASAPASAYASQDGGKTWTKLKGEITVVTSESTDKAIVLDKDAPYGNIKLTLDNVNTTGMLQFSSVGNASVFIKGTVACGAISGGADCRLSISGAQDSETNTLTVNSSSACGITAGREIYIHDLEALQIYSDRDGICSAKGNITLKNVSGLIEAGDEGAALKSEEPAAVILVNGSKASDTMAAELEF